MRLGLTEARREVYLNLIQDRHLNKLPKEAQPRSRDSDAILPPGVQLQNYHSMQLRAQPAPDGTLPGSQSPFVVHGQQGTDLRPEASEQPARLTVRAGGSRTGERLSSPLRSGDKPQKVAEDGWKGSPQDPARARHPAEESPDIVNEPSAGRVQEEKESTGEASSTDIRNCGFQIGRGPNARTAEGFSSAMTTAVAQLRTLTADGRPRETQEAHGIQLTARSHYASPAGALLGQPATNGSQSRKQARQGGLLAVSKGNATGHGSSKCDLTTLASAYPTFKVKSIPSSFVETGSTFNKTRTRAPKLTNSYFSPLPPAEASMPTTPGLTTLLRSQPRVRDPGHQSTGKSLAQPKSLLKKQLHQSQSHLEQLTMVFDDNARNRL